MTAPYRLGVATDIDGTLLDPQHRLTAATLAAVRRLRDAGVLLVLASSRYPGAVRGIQQALGLLGEPMVACQGAVVGRWLDDQFVGSAEQRVDPGAAWELTAAAQAQGFCVSWYYPDHWYAARGDVMAARDSAITGAVPTYLGRLDTSVLAQASPAKLALMAPPAVADRIGSLLAQVPAALAGSVSRPDYIEVVARGVSKWPALRALFETTGIAPEDTVAIGDGGNDLEMITGASVGIALAHAPAHVHEYADRVVPSNRDEGFAAAVELLAAEGRLG